LGNHVGRERAPRAGPGQRGRASGFVEDARGDRHNGVFRQRPGARRRQGMAAPPAWTPRRDLADPAVEPRSDAVVLRFTRAAMSSDLDPRDSPRRQPQHVNVRSGTADDGLEQLQVARPCRSCRACRAAQPTPGTDTAIRSGPELGGGCDRGPTWPAFRDVCLRESRTILARQRLAAARLVAIDHHGLCARRSGPRRRVAATEPRRNAGDESKDPLSFMAATIHAIRGAQANGAASDIVEQRAEERKPYRRGSLKIHDRVDAVSRETQVG